MLEAKILHAQRWLEKTLSENDGPKTGRTAVLCLRIDDVPDEPGMGFTNVFCLPDMDIGHLIEGLEKFVADLKAGQFVHSQVIEGETVPNPDDAPITKQ